MRFSGYRLSIALAAALLVAATAATAEGFDLASHVREFRLANGMRWLVVERRHAPVFSGIVMIRAGGVDETPGKTGIAHMFEHMAFKGSRSIGTRDWSREEPLLQEIERTGAELTALRRAAKPDRDAIAKLSARLAELQREADRYQMKNEVWELLMRNGAHGINAYTSKDHTAYYASMPATRFALWARVTAEMVFHPAFREFYTERSVVAEERRSSTENDPEGALANALLEESFASGPYQWSTIGEKGDVEGLTIGDARAFHGRFYDPSNMVGVVVGDVPLATVRRVAAEAFGGLPVRSRPPEPAVPTENRGGVSARLRFDAEPSVVAAFHKPTLPDPAEYAFDVIESLLCSGSASRLIRGLVYERRIARGIYCSDAYPGSRLPNLFVLWAEPLKGHSPKEVLAAVDEELARLAAEPVGAEELARARKQVTAGIVYALDRNDELAEALARFQIDFGDWRILAEYPERIDAVDAAAIQDVARRYLTHENRVVVERVRK